MGEPIRTADDARTPARCTMGIITITLRTLPTRGTTTLIVPTHWDICTQPTGVRGMPLWCTISHTRTCCKSFTHSPTRAHHTHFTQHLHHITHHTSHTTHHT